MNDRQWRDAWELFRTAKDLDGDERRSFLNSIHSDPEILAEVTAMLDEPEEGPAAEQPSKIGARFGRYEIVGMLGSGGMGQVYSGRDIELERMVAIKFLSPEMAASRPAVERLIHEAKAASALNHPHIVTVYEILRAVGDVAIVMELVEGATLRKFCGAPQPVSTVAGWGRQIAQALAAAHQRQIVHRDIKPENLMVRDDGIVKVLDFGLAQQTGLESGGRSTNSLGLLAGTLNYMSPEQTRGESATSASDVFSLGIVLFELATGSHPFQSDSPIETAHGIAHAEARRPSAVKPGIPPALDAILLAALDKVPGKRITAAELDRRLADVAPAATGKLGRRVALVAAAAIVMAMAALSLLWLRERVFTSKQPVMSQLTAQVAENRVTAAAISPDGATLAFAALGDSIFLRRMSDGLSRPLNTPAGIRVDRIAWFPDGSKLLVSGSTADGAHAGDNPGVWLIPASGEPRKIVAQGKDAVPSPDGARIAFTSPDESIVWVAAANGSAPRQVRSGIGSVSFSSLIWSPDGKRVSYQRRDFDPAVDGQVSVKRAQLVRSYRYAYEAVDVESGKLVTSARDFAMSSACGLPDGRILFLRWMSVERNDIFQVWEVQTDPRTGRLRGSPRMVGEEQPETWSSISASNDGKEVVAVRYRNNLPNIYIADLPPAGETPQLLNRRRMTFSEAQEFPHAWTADSRAIIFESNRNGSGVFDLYRQDIDQRNSDPLVVSPAVKVMAHLAPGGEWILYRESRDTRAWEVKRVPVQGGAPQPVLTGTDVNSEFRCGLENNARCVLRTVENGQFVFYELDPVRGRGRELARTAWSPIVVGDWDLSPDGSQAAIPNHDPRDARIRLVDLDGSGIGEKTVTLNGLKNLSGIVWAAGGKGWYASITTTSGGLLTYVDQQGRITNLLESRMAPYAVPSPDGRHIAFPDWSVASNAWLFRGLSR